MQRHGVRDIKVGLGSFLVTLCLLLTILFPLFTKQEPVRAAGENWWDTDWSYRKLVTINESKVGATLTNFPVLIYRSADTDLAADAQDDGDDICFVLYSDNTTKLNHEIESFNGATGALNAWVNITSLSGTVNTKVWMYYGHADVASQQNKYGTWDANYIAVWHMNDNTTSTIADSTSGKHNGSKTAANQPVEVDAKIGKGQSFGTSDWLITVPDHADWDTGGALTLESWIRYDIWDKVAPFGIMHDDSNYKYGYYFPSGTSTVSAYIRSATGGGISAAVTWPYDTNYHYLAETFDKTLASGRLKVSLDRTTTNSINAYDEDITAGDEGIMMGGWPSLNRYADNYYMDEVRISKIARNTSWIGATYNETSSPTTFHFFGAEEAKPLAVSWHTVQTVSGVLLNITTWVTKQTVQGTILNITGFKTTQTITGMILNTTTWRNIQTINGMIQNISEIPWHTIQTINGALQNTTTFKTTQTITGALLNSTKWITKQTINGVLLNTTSWKTKQTLSGGIYNATGENITISDTYPANGSTGIPTNIKCNITINQSDGKGMSLKWYENTTGAWKLQQTNGSIIPDWYDDSWSYRKLITVNHSQVPASLTNFPILVYLATDSGLANYAQADGDDICFVKYSDNTTKLNHEIELYTSATGKLNAWVNTSYLSSVADTKIWMYYGNAGSSSQQNQHGTWDSNYKSVYHLSETSGGSGAAIKDSTSNHVNGTNSTAGITYGAGGMAGTAFTFTGSSSGKVDFGTPAGWDNLDIMVEAWAKTTNSADAGDIRIVAGSNGFTNKWVLSQSGTAAGAMHDHVIFTNTATSHATASTDAVINDNTWHYLVGNAHTEKIYNNATLQSATTTDSWSFATACLASKGVDRFWTGTMDEVRISNTERNASWIRTTDATMRNTSTFISLGSSQASAGSLSNGTYRWVYTNASSSATKYYWLVIVNDTYHNMSAIYHFITTGVAPAWTTIQTISGVIQNISGFKTTQTISGAILNTSRWVTTQTIAGVLQNTTMFRTIQTINGVILNMTFPIVTTNATTDITNTSAKLWGYLLDDGGEPNSVWFEWDDYNLSEECAGFISTGTVNADNRSILWKDRHGLGTYNIPHYFHGTNYSYIAVGTDITGCRQGINEKGLSVANYDIPAGDMINWEYTTDQSYGEDASMHHVLGNYSTVADAAYFLATHAGYRCKYGLVSSELGIGAVVSIDTANGHSNITWVNNTWMALVNSMQCDGVRQDPKQARIEYLANRVLAGNGLDVDEQTKFSVRDMIVWAKDINSSAVVNGYYVSEPRPGLYTGTYAYKEIVTGDSRSAMIFVCGNDSYNGTLNLVWQQMGLTPQTGIFLPLSASYTDNNNDILSNITIGNGVAGITINVKQAYAYSGAYNRQRVHEIWNYTRPAENMTVDEYETLMETFMTCANSSEAQERMRTYCNTTAATALQAYENNNSWFSTNTTEDTGVSSGESFSETITGLSPGAVYYYRAWANNSLYTVNGSTLRFMTLPNKPYGIVNSSVGAGYVNLSWHKGTGAHYTVIERNTTEIWNWGGGTEVYNGTSDFYNSTGLNPGNKYYYQLWSFTSAEGLSQYSSDYGEYNTTTLPSSWKTLQTISGTLLNTTGWKTVQTISGLLMNTTTFRTTQTIQGVILNSTRWNTIQDINGVILNITGWRTTQSINGVIQNTSVLHWYTVQIINGGLQNTTNWKTEQTILGAILNTTGFKTMQTLTGVILNSTGFRTIQTITGAILNVSGFKTVQTIGGTIQNTTNWKTRQTLTGTILNSTRWNTIQTISGAVANISGFKTVQTISGAILNTTAFKTTQTLTGTILNTTGFKTVQIINGAIQNSTGFRTVQTINGMVLNSTGWRTTQTIIGTIQNTTNWKTRQTLTGTILNATLWKTTQTINGVIRNISQLNWHTIQTINGAILNSTNWKTTQILNGEIHNTLFWGTTQTLTGTILNSTRWDTIQTISGAVENISGFKTIQTITGTVLNTTGFRTTQTINGAVQNTTRWNTIQTLNGNIQNISVLHWYTTQTITGEIQNTTQWHTTQTITGTINNILFWNTVQILTGSIQNVSGFKTVQTINGMIQNTTGFKTTQTINGAILNTTSWKTKQTINGIILNATFWRTTQTINGIIQNISVTNWKTVQTINGVVLNTTSWETIQTITGEIKNTLFWGTVQTITGLIQNTTQWKTSQTLNGTILNTSALGWHTAQTINGEIKNTSTSGWSTIQTITGEILNISGWRTTQILNGTILNTSATNWATIQTIDGTILNTSSQPLVFTAENPVNNTINTEITNVLWNLTIEDPDGDLFNWTLECQGWTVANDNYDSANVETNGSKEVHIGFQPGFPLSYSTTYKVYVNATDNSSDPTAWTRAWYQFTTKAFVPPPNNPPNIPSNPDPVNHAIGVNINKDLGWTGGDPDGDTVTYDVYFGITITPPKLSGNQSGVTYDPGTMVYNETYYWKINAWDEHGLKTVGPLWDFNTTRWYTIETINGIIRNSTHGVQIINIYPANESYIQKTQPTVLFTLANSTGVSNFTVYTGNTSLTVTAFLFNDSYVGNGTYHDIYFNATDYYQDYYWGVCVWDNGAWLNETYHFMIEYESNIIPMNNNDISIIGIFGVLGIFGVIGFVMALRKKRR